MANNNIIGEEFEKYVRKQINVRQEIHGSGTSNNPRSIEYLNYLNSKTAWVKLASGAKISEERLKREGMDTSFSGMELAKQRVLFGGVASLEEEKLIQRGTNSNRNLNITDPNSGTYNVNQKGQINDLEFGLVPMPGITSVDIKNKNRGSIKEATVKLTAYTREQFDFIDLLYMRLGYTVFLEWGWSTYYDNNEEYKNMNYTLIEDKDGFFNEGWGQGDNSNNTPTLTNAASLAGTIFSPNFPISTLSPKTFSDFLNKITEYRGKHDGNYDGLLAKVRNFDWTISENGTYDITLSLISVGDVIESLKMNMPPTKEVIDFFTKLNFLEEGKELGGETPEIFPIDNSIKAHLNLWKFSDQQSIEGSTNPWENGLTYRLDGIDIAEEDGRIETGRFVEFQPEVKIPINNRVYTLSPSEVENKILELKREYKEEIKNGDIVIGTSPFLSDVISVSGQKSLTTTKFISDGSSYGKEVFTLNYITEEGNKNVDNPQYYMRLGYLLQYIESTIIPIEKNTSEKIIKIHTDQWDSNRMYHFPYQQSYDPRVCLVRSKYPVGLNQSLEVLPQLPGWFEEGNDYAYLMNIYINFSQIESSINDNLDEEGNLSLYDFLSSLCSAINKALGGVNNLEPTIDEETNTIRIIDGSYTPDEPPADDYTLELYGYNTTNNSSNFVRKFSVKSTVSKEYASMVSIGATAAGYTKGMEATMLSKWNTGITDRFKEEYIQPDPSTNPLPSGSANEAVINYVENVLLKPPITNRSSNGGYYLDTELINTQVSFATEFYKYCQYQFKQKNPKYGSPIIGFVPINLNLSMDGISGMKIYNVVRTSTRFLPKNYTDSLRFLTTSVNHKLNNNDWETSIDTVVIPENYDEKGNKIFPYNERFEEVNRILIENASLKYGFKIQTASGPLAKTRTNPNEGFFTGNRSGDTSLGIEGKSYQGELAKGALSDQEIQQKVKNSGMEFKRGGDPVEYLRDNAIRKRIVEIAASYVGLNELPGNNQGWHNIIYENKFKELKYKWTIPEPWCAWFCQLVWKEAFTTGNAYTPSIDSAASAVNIPTTFADTYKGIWNGLLEGGAIVSPGTATIKNNFKTNPKLQFITRKQVLNKTKTPKPGDIAKYTYKDGGHVDIVVATYPGGYAAIGGNTGAGNSRDGGATKFISNKSYNASSLDGFAVVPTISNQKT
jgi:hypothetical protein